MQDLTDLIREYCDYCLTRVHTNLPGVVNDYNAKKRRAIIQPSLKRRAGNKEYVVLPLLIDVPVLFPGTKRYTIHIPLERNDEVAIFFSERALEAWKAAGQDNIEDADPRRFNLSDAYCIPGLQAVEFIATEEPGLHILHKEKYNGKFISHILMTDYKLEAKYKEKCKVVMEDDEITCNTEHNKIHLTKKNINITNSMTTLDINEDITTLNTGSFLVNAKKDIKLTAPRIDLN